ncbi:unnamed protein product [Trichogramma brassicae]|uniref:protein acetyllysine N-acetyltransferase n=1 Tax=Trichogramma brassicae TaxID=86971 RepID=A0A6H5J467_9HYME|nr:unnamed protein product [Trichogramma brassicae]
MASGGIASELATDFGLDLRSNVDEPVPVDDGATLQRPTEHHFVQDNSSGEQSRFTESSSDSKSSPPSSSTSDLTNSMDTPTEGDSTNEDTIFPLDANNDKDEVSSTVSNLSDITGISILSQADDDADLRNWREAAMWVEKQIKAGADPRELLKYYCSDAEILSQNMDDSILWKMIFSMIAEPDISRKKLSNVNTIQDVANLIRTSKNIIVLTGAGVSVSCGIPDFRSRDGIYSRLAQDFPDLPDPQAMFDINYFLEDPRPFYKFAKEIYPGQFKPSPCHKFIKMLETQKKLLRNYSQNIDTLERVAGIENLIECHGSFATASCTKCKYQVQADGIREDIFAQKIPLCPKCLETSLPAFKETTDSADENSISSQGVMKPDIVFFGEGLPDAFHDTLDKDLNVCDLLIVIGSSLKVKPVALIPTSIPASVPQILINRESLQHLQFDVELLGDGDVIVNELCHMLGDNFKEVCYNSIQLTQAQKLLPDTSSDTDSWNLNQDTLASQDLSQDSLAMAPGTPESLPRNASSKRSSSECSNEDEESNNPFDDRPWKKLKNNGMKEYLPNDANECSKIFNNIAHYYEKKLDYSESESENTYDNTHEHQRNDKRGTSQSIEDSKEACDSIEASSNMTFDSEFNENVEKNFNISESHGEKTLLNNCDGDSSSMSKCMTTCCGESPTTSLESSRIAEELCIPEDCHVVPRMIECLKNELISSNHVDPSKSTDQTDEKFRHSSIDSVLDSALGDSCNSADCQKQKLNEESIDTEKQSYSSTSINPRKTLSRTSLALRLPENSYFQIKKGVYIFPGAEVYAGSQWSDDSDSSEINLSQMDVDS